MNTPAHLSPEARLARIREGNRKGGLSRSPAKVEAVRKNGAKGGRPRKATDSPPYGAAKGDLPPIKHMTPGQVTAWAKNFNEGALKIKGGVS